MKPELISFKMCPYVQRSVILLREKGMDFDITYIDPYNPPAWFTAISPTGKVPVLRDGDAILFESAVINEYLDEIYPPSMHPANPLQRARNRMWIEFNAALNTLQRNITVAPDAAALEIAVDKLAVEYDKVETWLDDGPFFNGEVFSLVDAAYAPTLMRSAILSREFGVELFNHRPRLAALTEAYLARGSVIHSVVADFAELYRRRMQNEGGWLARTH